MKSSLFFKLIFATLALALTVNVFAAKDTHKSDFQISAPAQVNGTLIPAGDYTAKWEGAGPTVQVSILQGKKVLATAPAQIVPLNHPAADTQAEIKTSPNGDRELMLLQFSGKPYSLELGPGSAKVETKTEPAN